MILFIMKREIWKIRGLKKERRWLDWQSVQGVEKGTPAGLSQARSPKCPVLTYVIAEFNHDDDAHNVSLISKPFPFLIQNDTFNDGLPVQRIIDGLPVQLNVDRHADVGMSGCRDVGMSGCRDVGMSGCRDVGMSGCRDVGMSWCRMPKLRGDVGEKNSSHKFDKVN